MNILVTGAAGGIGYLTSLTLALRGHFVYLTCHTLSEEKNLKEKLKAYENLKVMKLDVTKEDDINKVLNLDIDVLISNAAMGKGGSIIEADMKKIKESFEVNVFSNFNLVKKVLQQMIEKDSGRVIMISSLISKIPLPFVGIYSATKASISNLTSALRKELSLISNVQITLVEPGLYHTGFNQLFLDNKYDSGKYFSSIKKELYTVEHFFIRLLEKKKLDSIVVKIVRAVEAEKTKKVYRAPKIQSIFIKLYDFFR